VTPLSTWRLIVKDLRLGPRSPVFLYSIALPIVMTLLIAGVFGSLFEPAPRLAIADLGDSQVSPVALELQGVEVTVGLDAAELRASVEAHDFDAGLVLPPASTRPWPPVRTRVRRCLCRVPPWQAPGWCWWRWWPTSSTE